MGPAPFAKGTETGTRRLQPQTGGPVRLLPPDKNPSFKGLSPDLVITSADLSFNCDGGETWSATIIATVTNQSSFGTADLTKNPFHIVLGADWWFTGGLAYLEKPLTKDLSMPVGGPGVLKPGESWKGTVTITGIPKANIAKAKKEGKFTSSFGFAVKADPMKVVAEESEKNNVKLIYLPITTCSQP